MMMMILGMGVTARRLMAIRRAAAAVDATAAAISEELRSQIHDPALWMSTQMAASTALGIVFLMTAKPGLNGSLLATAIALTLGATIGAVSLRRWQDQRVPIIPAEEDAIIG